MSARVHPTPAPAPALLLLLSLLLLQRLPAAPAESAQTAREVNRLAEEDPTEDDELDVPPPPPPPPPRARSGPPGGGRGGRCISAEAGIEASEAKYFFYGEHPVPLRILSTNRVTHQVGLS